MKVKNNDLIIMDLETRMTLKLETRREVALFVGARLGEIERELEVFKDEAIVYCVGNKRYMLVEGGNYRAPTLGFHRV